MQTVGIIPSPGIAHQHAKKIIPNVKQLLSKRTKHSQWNFDIKVDLMIGSAEDVHESVEKAAQIKEEHQWDYVVCLTDLPSISDNKVVVSDFNSDKHVAMLLLPSLGFIDLKRKLVKHEQISLGKTSLILRKSFQLPLQQELMSPYFQCHGN